jgi:hypothetical protein
MTSLRAECREFLLAPERPEAQAHLGGCRDCAEHASFRARIAPLLRARPPLPAALRSPCLLEGVHERIVDAAEQAPLGRLVARHEAPRAPETVWPEQVLDTALGAAVRTAPPAPSPVAWNHVRRSIFARLAARRIARTRAGVWIGLTGVAAAVLIGSLLTLGGTPEQVAIVFTDLQAAPGNEFAVLRYGALR